MQFDGRTLRRRIRRHGDITLSSRVTRCCTSCSPPPNNKHHSRPRFLFCVFIVPPPRARATPEAGFGWLAVVVVLRDRPSPPSSTSSPLGLLTCPCTALARSLAPHADGRPARALSPPLESSPDGATLCRAGSRGRMDDGGGGGGGVHEAQGGGMVRKQAGRGIAWSTAIRRWDDGRRWMQGWSLPPRGGLSEVGWCCSQLSRRFGRCAARPARLSACCLALAVRRRRAPVGLAGVDS